MARGKGTSEGTGKIKFRMVEFEMDGTDTSLEDGIKAIAAALNRAGGGTQTKLILKGNGTSEHTIQPPELVEDQPEEQAAQEEGQEEARTPRAQTKPRKVTPRKVVPDFKLDDVTPTFKDFATEKAPSSDLQRYLVIAYWAKEYKGIAELSPDHFYTAYKAMGWPTPKDMAQPIRDLTRHENGKFSPPATKGNGCINHVGESFVVEMKK